MNTTTASQDPHHSAEIGDSATSVESVAGHQEADRYDSRQQYRDIFEAASDGLIVNDMDTGIVLEANTAACLMHGYDDMSGLHPSVFIHPNSHHLFADYVAALQAGQEFRCRAQDVRRDGTTFDVEVLGRRIVYQGRSAMLGVVRDITEQVRAYQTLEERVVERTNEIQRRRRVAEGMRELIAVVNSRQTLDEILSYLVEQARSLLGSDASAVFLPIEDRADDLLGIRASSGLAPEHANVRMPLGISSTGLAFGRRKPVFVSDLQAALPSSSRPIEELQLDERPNAIHVIGLPSILENPEREPGTSRTGGMRAFASLYGAFLSVPMTAKDEAYGTLSLYYHDPREFSDDDISLANAFADQAALAIENARLRVQARQAAALEERQRLARELHDAVTQTLFSASLISDVIPDLWESDPSAAKQRLEQLRRLTRSALAEMRILLLELRPSALTDIPLADLLRQLVDAANGATLAQVSLEIETDSRVQIVPDAQIALYRIAQEALNNISKHAQAHHVSISYRCDPEGSVDLSICDDGRGFDPSTIPAGHLGIGFMRERAEAIGASIKVRSSISEGTRVEVHWHHKEGLKV